MQRRRIAWLGFIFGVALALPACGAIGSVSVNGTWVGKGTRRHDSTLFAMLIVVQEGNNGVLTATGQTCDGPHPDSPGTWISYTGQGHNNDIQGSGVDLTLINRDNVSTYFGFHGTLSGSTLALDDETSSEAPAHLSLQQGTASDFQTLCNQVGSAIAAAATRTAQADAAAATATVAAAPQLAGTWAVAESNVVCTPGPSQPTSVCNGNIANYTFVIQQSGLSLTATIPAGQTGQSADTLDGSLQGNLLTLSDHSQVQSAQGPVLCFDKYIGMAVSSSQMNGTYTSKCEYAASGALILNQTGDWTATRQS